MKRKTFFIIISVLCILGAIALTVYSVIVTTRPAVLPGLVSLGELPLEAFDAQQELDEYRNTQYTISYRYIDPKYGEIVYSTAVDATDYDSYKFDEMRVEEQPVEIPDENSELTRKTQIKRYVYAYPDGGQYAYRFYDRYMGLSDVSDEIYGAEPVNSTYYFIFSGILLIAGAYLMFIAIAGRRKAD